MWVERLILSDFRGFAGKVEINLNPNVNLIVGVNGAGKTAMVEALASLLSVIPNLLEGEKAAVFGGGDQSNIHVGAEACTWGLLLRHQEHDVGLVLGARLNPANVDSSVTAEKSDFGFFQTLSAQKDTPSVLLPPIQVIHAGSTRAPLSYQEKQSTEHPRLRAYQGCFDSESVQFEGLERWFEQEENLENEQKIRRRNFSFELPSLKAVRHAVTTFLSALRGVNLGDLRVVRAHTDPFTPASGALAITKNEKTLFLEQLSDGERRLLLMVADTAQRMVVLNPGLNDPLEAEGIMVVDEIELHLHPTWQRTVVPALRAAFPKLQLILTTHSPQVLSTVRDEQVIVLKDGQVLNGANVYGQDSNTILQELMDTPRLPAPFQQSIDELYSWLESHPRKAKQRLKKLEAELGADHPELVRVRAMMEFLAA